MELWIVLILCYCIICWLGGLLLERPIIAAVKMVGPNSTLKNCTIRLKTAKYAVYLTGNDCSILNSRFVTDRLTN